MLIKGKTGVVSYHINNNNLLFYSSSIFCFVPHTKIKIVWYFFQSLSLNTHAIQFNFNGTCTSYCSHVFWHGASAFCQIFGNMCNRSMSCKVDPINQMNIRVSYVDVGCNKEKDKWRPAIHFNKSIKNNVIIPLSINLYRLVLKL